MSLFNIAKNIGKDLVKVASIANPFNLNPVQKIRESLEIVTNKNIPLTKEEKKINVALAVPAGAVVGGLVGGPLGAVKGALIVPTIQTAVQESPKIEKFISTTVGNLLSGETQEKAGKLVGGLVEGAVNPEDLTGKDIRNIATGIGVGGLVVGAGTLAYDYLKDKKEDDKILDTSSIVTPVKTGETSSVGTPTVAPLRETQTITSGKRYKRSKKKESPTIRINNAIAINNTTNGLKIQNKRYLKEYVY